MKHIFRIAVAVPICLSLHGCGKWAKAKPQEVETVAIPEYPSFKENVYGLTPSIPSIGYGGTMVLLNKEINPVDLADLLQASIDSRKAWAGTKRFTEEVSYALKYAEGGLYETAIKDMKAELKLFEIDAKSKTSIPFEVQAESANLWISQELDLLFSDKETEKSNAKTTLDQYCEAKIWELATNSFFASNKYASTPTPMAFCSPYYEKQGLLQGDSCTDNPEGSSYFSCLWNEGVKKTSFFQKYSEDQRTKINALLSEEKTTHNC